MTAILSLFFTLLYLLNNFLALTVFQNKPLFPNLLKSRVVSSQRKASLVPAIPRVATNSLNIMDNIGSKLLHLSQKAPQLNRRVLRLALQAYKKAEGHGDVKKSLLTVIDFSLPSSKQRLWIFDINQEKLLYNTYVAHGMNSGMSVPNHFSNSSSSKQSSLGTYLTKGTYFGSKGLSLNLQGLEKGFNDNAYSRRVVMHGAWYVEPDFIKKTGRAGRSWGCPSIAKTLAKPVINTIKDGSVIFAYYPDKNYLTHSQFLGMVA